MARLAHPGEHEPQAEDKQEAELQVLSDMHVSLVLKSALSFQVSQFYSARVLSSSESPVSVKKRTCFKRGGAQVFQARWVPGAFASKTAASRSTERGVSL